MRPVNHHCCILTLNSHGLLIEGKAQSGKTSLMLGLLERAKAEGIEAALVSDDQAFLSALGSGLSAEAPETIAGKVEISGYGIVEYPAIGSCTITHVVKLVPGPGVERMPDKKIASILEVKLPLIEVPERHEENAVRIVFAYLDLL